MISLPSLARWGHSSTTRRIAFMYILYEFTIFIAHLVRKPDQVNVSSHLSLATIPTITALFIRWIYYYYIINIYKNLFGFFHEFWLKFASSN